MSTIIGRAMVAGGGNTSTIERLEFTYTGQYNERLDDRVVELYTGGVFTVPKDVLVDLFLVGGGGAGGRGNSAAGSNVWPGGGGGGGYTKTVNSFSLHAGTKYTVVIGNGGSSHGADGESTSFGVNSVLGGKGGYESTDINNPHAGAGGAGGSGGGGAVNGSSVIGSGGSDGSDGSTGYPVATVYGIGGKGQGTTTREFGEPTGKLYAGGGGGGRHSTSDNNQSPGGTGGGGTGSWSGSNRRTDWVAGTPGEPRTGGGGGGGVMHQTSTSSGWQDSSAAGGSGIVCVRLHKEEKLDFTYTGDYTEREDGVVELKSSGTLAFQNPAVIDVFMVGGGGSGIVRSGSANSGYGGGGGGYTRTIKRIAVSKNNAYSVIIGAGGVDGNSGGSSAFSNYAVNGGVNGQIPGGGKGGSGGGSGVTSNSNYGTGGSDGNDGENGGSDSASKPGGHGQGFTTREFGEITGKLYAGGGGGGRYMVSSTPIVSMGGSGGGGSGAWAGTSDSQAAAAGVANTGGGGGGGANHLTDIIVNGASGGSGIVCFRDAAELPELAGTWMLNNRVYPVNNFNQSIGCTVFINNTVTQHDITTITDDGTTLRFFKGGGIEYSCTYSSQIWNVNSQVTSIRFPAGATASDEFRAWLASNATKQ